MTVNQFETWQNHMGGKGKRMGFISKYKGK